MSDTYFLIFGIIIALIGMILLFSYFKVLLSCRQAVIAQITSVKKEKITLRGSSVYSYRPVFSYSVDGHEYSGEATFTTHNKTKYNSGDSLKIYVSATQPGLYRFDGKIAPMIIGLIMVVIGGLFIVLSL